VSAAITRDLPVQIERLLKRELKSLAPTIAAEVGILNAAAFAAASAAAADGTKSRAQADSKAIERALPAAVAAAMESAVGPRIESVCASMQKALPAAVASAMETSVVPRFQLACGEMFEQVRGTFERGIDDLATELYTQKENAVAAEAGPLVSSLRAAADEVRAAAEMLAAMPAAMANPKP
jgi:enhancer of mRNA-decapping protein 4